MKLLVHICMCIMMQKEKTEHFPDYQNGTVVLKSDGVEFTVEGYFCPALAKAVMTMKKGENVILTVKPEYAFGENGRPASGDEVKLVGKLQDGTVFVKKGEDDEQPFEFKIDEEQVIDGLDKAVMNI
ncbi:Peptidyl-prolyl cis-trans isomerase [Arachis hypogaea]|nr:Peptidyl-prolyl cis-trans isomerase [Arachis hypogaea]